MFESTNGVKHGHIFDQTHCTSEMSEEKIGKDLDEQGKKSFYKFSLFYCN